MKWGRENEINLAKIRNAEHTSSEDGSARHLIVFSGWAGQRPRVLKPLELLPSREEKRALQCRVATVYQSSFSKWSRRALDLWADKSIKWRWRASIRGPRLAPKRRGLRLGTQVKWGKEIKEKRERKGLALYVFTVHWTRTKTKTLDNFWWCSDVEGRPTQDFIFSARVNPTVANAFFFHLCREV